MNKKCFVLSIVSMLCLLSCRSQQSDELYFPRCIFLYNGVVKEYYGYSYKWEVPDFVIRHPVQTDDGGQSYVNKDILHVTFDKMRFNWYIPSPMIEDGAKYYWDTRTPFFKTAANLGAVSIADYNFHPDSENAQSFSTGWFSFSKNVDNTIVSFRVTFEMDFFGVDRKDEIRQGRIDFTSKTKIIGEEYLR